MRTDGAKKEDQISAKSGHCSYFYPLFEHMLCEHGLILTDSELHEIVRAAELCPVKKNQPVEE